MQDPTRLTPEEYWKWRTTIEEMKLANSTRDLALLRHQLLLKDAEILKYKGIIHQRTAVQFASDGVESARKEYDRVKSEIEERLGVSLNGKMIDEFTFEVKDVPAEQTPLKGGSSGSN